MKTLIVAVVLLVCVCLGIGADMIYTHITLTELISDAESLSAERDGFSSLSDKLSELDKKWSKQRNIMIYLVDMREIEEADMSFTRLCNNARSGDFDEYLVSRAEFIHALRRLLRIGEISVENIL